MTINAFSVEMMLAWVSISNHASENDRFNLWGYIFYVCWDVNIIGFNKSLMYRDNSFKLPMTSRDHRRSRSWTRNGWALLSPQPCHKDWPPNQ